MKRLAIIPARGGSKRIPRKNVIDFFGKPIISYPIEAALQSSLFDEVHVSTDDEEIAAIAKKAGASLPFMREARFADDFTPVLEVARFVLRKYKDQNKEFDSFTMIMPCSPLITSEDLIKANSIFEMHKLSTPVLSVSKYPSPIEWAFKENNNILEIADSSKLTIRSQDLTDSYFDTGNFSIQNAKEVLSNNSMVPDKFLKYDLHKAKKDFQFLSNIINV